MSTKKAFTLLEILIVLGIIAVLATSVVVLLNPAKRFEAAKDKQREIHVQVILNAVYQYREATGSDCPDMPEEIDPETSMPIFKTIGTEHYDLYKCLVPFYLDNPIFSPSDGSRENTRYEIWRNPYTKRVTVRYEKNHEIFAGPKDYWIFNTPTVEIIDIPEEEITHTSAKIYARVISEGGSAVFERGVVWSTAPEPTILDDRSTQGLGTGEFDYTIKNLKPDTWYYVRAYARNDIGVGYSPTDNEKKYKFKTLEAAPGVKTLDAEKVTYNQATLRGEITSLGPPGVKSAGYYFKLNGVKINNSEGYLSEPKVFEYTYVGLTPLQEYSFQACAWNTFGGTRNESCGKEKKFTPNYSAPLVDVEVVRNGAYSATIKGIITNTGGRDITKWGICYADGFVPNYPQGCKEETGTKTQPFDFTMDIPFDGESALKPNNEYCVLAFAWNGEMGTDKLCFTTLMEKPKIETVIEEVDHYSAKLGIEVKSNGGSPITEHKICWGTTSPVDCISKGSLEVDKITYKIKNFIYNTDYIVQAAAKNAKGWSYATTKNFKITDTPQRPLLGSTEAFNIGLTSATFKGIIKNHGGKPITNYGFCWKNAEPPTIDEGCTEIMPGGQHGITLPITEDSIDTEFQLEKTDLKTNTKYLVWGYAKNEIGESQGEVFPFQTLPPQPPEVETYIINPATIIGRTATAGGKITNSGGDPNVIGGVCFSTEENPEYTTESVEGRYGCTTDWTQKWNPDNPNNGVFTSKLEKLIGGTKYYYRAYAKNGVGVNYGAEYSFVAGSDPGKPCSGDNAECRTGTAPNYNLGYCVDGVCCNSACNESTGQGTCWACNIPGSVGTCTVASLGTDPREQCSESWSCDGVCKRVGNPGYCGEKTGACVVGITQHTTTAGLVCSNGQWVTPSSTAFCDSTINCVTNACSASRWYRGCALGGTTCTDTGRVSYTAWNATNGYVINETTYKTGTSCTEATPSTTLYCATAKANDNACQYSTYYRACLGTGTCRTDNTGAYRVQTTCGTGQATMGATECKAVSETNYCSGPHYACSNSCQSETSYRGCAGSGSTCETTKRATSTTNCSSAQKCDTDSNSSTYGRCISGYPDPCKYCLDGSKIDAPNTRWGAGLYGCGTSGGDSRCYQGTCYTCSGTNKKMGKYTCNTDSTCPTIEAMKRTSDNTVCWTLGALGQSCNTVCGGSQYCVAENWNDYSTSDCFASVCKSLIPTSSCSGVRWYQSFFPGWADTVGSRNTCRARQTDDPQDCSAKDNDTRRICVCQK